MEKGSCQKPERLAMCYTFADTITIPQGLFYVLDRATGKRYKAASTKEEAKANWKAGRLQ